MPNPYSPIGPLRNTDSFVGRKTELRWLARHLVKESIDVNLIGPNRCGKTSLLYNFQDLIKYYVDAKNLSNLRIVYLNLQDPALQSARSVFSAIAKSLNHTLAKKQDNSLFDVRLALNRILEKSTVQRVIIMLDEVEVAFANPHQFPLAFWHLLRSSVLEEKLIWLIASRLSLEEYFIRYSHLRDDASPAFNIFANVRLEDFQDEDTEELFRLSDIPFTWDEKSWIKEYAGGSPFKLQVACHTLYELKSGSLYLQTGEQFRKSLSEADYTFQVYDLHPKIRKLRKAARILMVIIPLTLLIPVAGLITRKVGDSLDSITNLLAGLILILLLSLVILGKLPLQKPLRYIERLLGLTDSENKK